MKVIISPYVTIGKKKRRTYKLNMNTFRKLHFHTKNQLKRKFEEDNWLLVPKEKFEKVIITYEYYKNTNRLEDIANICSIVDKFFCDLLTKKGVIVDDNCEIVREVRYVFAGYSDTERIEVTVEEWDDEK